MAVEQVRSKKNQPANKPMIGLVMMGGGARAAYQVGVLKGVSELVKKGEPSPFKIISGISAGAINATALASAAHNYRKAVFRLLTVWGNFHCDQIFYTKPMDIMKTGAHLLIGMMLVSLTRNKPMYLLDRAPLRELLDNYLHTRGIQRNIDNGHLHAVSVTASGYSSGQNVTFFQGNPGIKSWNRARRTGCRENVNVQHLMASSAIPFIFKSEKVNREFFGDGSIRLIAPLSAALHLGADRLMIIGNRKEEVDITERINQKNTPSFAEIASHVLNSIFLDSLEADLERLQRINNTVSKITDHAITEHDIPLRNIDTLLVSPSEDIGKLAAPYAKDMPFTIRLLLRGIGAMRTEGSSLMSYLLFEKNYCRDLIDLGFEDSIAKKDEIKDFLML
ncbi:patatin-like phospholipase family protein [Beggiatoa alba]|nr:patatin-like phospholipase family protein [Beggiatoa alba]